jgi:hypothetical protein
VLEHDPDLLQALRTAAEQFRRSTEATNNDTDVWRMVRAVVPLRNEAGTIESVVQAGAVETDQMPVSVIMGSACRVWQCIAQMLQWAQRNAHAVCALAQQLYPNDANVRELPTDATQAGKHAAFWRAVGTVVSVESVKAISAAAELVGTETKAASAVRSSGTGALLTEPCTSFVAQIAQLGTKRECVARDTNEVDEVHEPDVALANCATAVICAVSELYQHYPFVTPRLSQNTSIHEVADALENLEMFDSSVNNPDGSSDEEGDGEDGTSDEESSSIAVSKRNGVRYKRDGATGDPVVQNTQYYIITDFLTQNLT